MIVSRKRRFIYIGPPKTATTTLHHWLSQPALCESRWDPKGQDQHRTDLPDGCEDYLIVVSIRNPLDRAVSLWRHSQSPMSLRAEGNPTNVVWGVRS